MTEAAYATVRLMQTFDAIRSCDEAPWAESLTLTCCSTNGTRISLTPAEARGGRPGGPEEAGEGKEVSRPPSTAGSGLTFPFSARADSIFSPRMMGFVEGEDEVRSSA